MQVFSGLGVLRVGKGSLLGSARYAPRLKRKAPPWLMQKRHLSRESMVYARHMPLVAAAQIADRIAEIMQLIAALHAAEDADGRLRTLEWDALYREREILQAALHADRSTVAVREPCLGLSEQFAMPFQPPQLLDANSDSYNSAADAGLSESPAAHGGRGLPGAG